MPGRSLLNLFVYGTLKHGQRNHDRFCRGAASIVRATVRGRLYDLPFGFPALVVPEEDVLAVGTTDYLSDAALPGHVGARPLLDDLAGWDTVRGELATFEDPGERLPAIDALEDFRPGEGGLYTRVLVPVTPEDGGQASLAWAYAAGEVSGIHLPGGEWPPD